jgi:hypothetical protein
MEWSSLEQIRQTESACGLCLLCPAVNVLIGYFVATCQLAKLSCIEWDIHVDNGDKIFINDSWSNNIRNYQSALLWALDLFFIYIASHLKFFTQFRDTKVESHSSCSNPKWKTPCISLLCGCFGQGPIWSVPFGYEYCIQYNVPEHQLSTSTYVVNQPVHSSRTCVSCIIYQLHISVAGSTIIVVPSR